MAVDELQLQTDGENLLLTFLISADFYKLKDFQLKNVFIGLKEMF